MRQTSNLFCFFCGLLASSGLHAQTPPPPVAAQRLLATPVDRLNAELPSWMQFGGEYRLRGEGFGNLRFTESNDDLYLLHRIRLTLLLRPAPWFRFFAQGQDARVFGDDKIAPLPPFTNRLDLRQAYIELGSLEQLPFGVRVGRQELAFGEDRLLGAANWGNAARVFDAVRGQWHGKGYRVDGFAASIVTLRDAQVGRHAPGDYLHGLYGSFSTLIPKAKVEPYTYWHLAPRVTGELGTGSLNERTVGMRIAGTITPRVEYTTEMVGQFGAWGGDTIRAWAGHWRVIRTLNNSRYVPRLRMEYNYATGDSNQGDRIRNTFDVLYPTPHDKYGLADQVGWKNIHHIAAILEGKPSAKWVLQLKYHNSWLASPKDGLYNAGGNLLLRDRNGLSGRHVGQEVDVQALWVPDKHVSLGMGLGHLFAGEFIRNTSPGKGYTFPYVMLTYSF